jgi:hypothetical protein
MQCIEPVESGSVSVREPSRNIPQGHISAALLLGALSAALLAQGAYYPRAQVWVVVLVAAALLLLPRAGSLRAGAADSRAPGSRAPGSRGLGSQLADLLTGTASVAVPALGLAGWALADAALHAQLRTALPYLVLLAGVLAVLFGCSRLDAAARDLVLTGLVSCGVLLAVVGWLGVALHLPRWTWQGQGLWRASSTLTYPNATAVVLAMLTLVVLARLTDSPPSVRLGLGATVLLVGLAATLSRAGLLALAVGVLVLAAARGPAAVARAGRAAALGAAVATLGLIPAMTGATSRPGPAILALAGGLAVSAGAAVLRWNRGVAGGFALLALLLCLPRWSGIVAITGVRLTVDDPERAASFRAASGIFGEHRLIGAGPSLSTLTWSPGQDTRIYRYAHNEYLQVLAELGIVGGLLLAALLVSTLRLLGRRCRSGGAVSAGALAAVTALAVHAGFDFVWHIPAIPLLAAALVGLASPAHQPAGNTQPTGETSRKENR